MKAGWQSKQFEDCVEKVTYTARVQRKDFLGTGEHPIISQEEAFINGYWNEAADLFHLSRPVVVFGDHTKVLKYVDFDFVLGADGVKILAPKDFLVPRYFYYHLQTANLDSLGYARHYKLLKELEIAFPSADEQQRIVAILDEAFDGIATAKANAEKNLQNARELFDRLAQSLFPLGHEREGARALDDFSELIVDCEHKTAPTQEHGIPSIRTPNIGKGQLSLKDVYRVSEETYQSWTRRAVPQAGDLILAREAPAGNVAVVPEGLKVCLGQRTVLIRPKQSLLDSTYLAHLLLQPDSQGRLLAHSRGATVQHVNMKDIRAFPISAVPPLDEQRGVVAKLTEFLGKREKLESLYQQKLTALAELKKSLLHEAFSGRL